MTASHPVGSAIEDPDFLAATWNSCMLGLGIDAAASGPQQALRTCLHAYQEEQRSYHTLQHLVECLRLLDKYGGAAQQRHEVCIALWYHDVVYDVHAHDNEKRSANMAVAFLRNQGCPEEMQRSVHRLIMATSHAADLISPDERLICDIDLAVLGAPPQRYSEYTRQVREEYAFVPATLFASKRIELMEMFLARPRIFGAPELYARFEQQARENIAMEIVELRSGLATY